MEEVQIKKLKDDLLTALQTELMYNPSVIAEMSEVESMSVDQLLRKAEKLGLKVERYKGYEEW